MRGVRSCENLYVGTGVAYAGPTDTGGCSMSADAKSDQLQDFLMAAVPPSLLDVSGHLLYSGRQAWSGVSQLYVMGLNPGGDPGSIAETVRESTRRILASSPNYSAYRDDRWIGPAGAAPMQRSVLHMFERIGIDPGLVPSTNLIFARSRAAIDIAPQMFDLADVCWPFHAASIVRAGARVVVCFGSDAARYVRTRLRANSEVDSYIETNGRGWVSRTFQNAEGMQVVQLTHPSRVAWRNPASDPTPLVQRALMRAKHPSRTS